MPLTAGPLTQAVREVMPGILLGHPYSSSSYSKKELAPYVRMVGLHQRLNEVIPEGTRYDGD